jgi:4-amino-4-deoxy-L-arabinose transferase-like glycosyltransferase
VFSFMSGIVHPYYSVILAPAIGALVGAGVVELWAWRRRSVVGGLVLGAAVAITAVLAAVLLARTPDFVPWLGPVLAVGGIVAAVFLALPAGRAPARLAAAAVGLALVIVLAGPASYALATMDGALAGGDPQVGPATVSAVGGLPGISGAAPGLLPGGDGRPDQLPGGLLGGDAALPPGGALPGAIGAGDGDGLPGDELGTLASDLIDYLVAKRGSATWLVAVPSANLAGPIQLQTGIPVMAMGGFSGGDPVPTLEQLKGYVRSGQLRFVMAGGTRGPSPGPGGARGSNDSSSAIADWVAEACTPVQVTGPGGTGAAGDGTGLAAAAVYDCAGGL